MARSAPSVERTVAVLKLLADHPRERFSLSDITRRLASNKATCHAMLSELVEEGVLIRHPADKTYMPGPALVWLSYAAVHDARQALEHARSEMAAIHSELDVSCVATGLVGNEIVVLAREDVARPLTGYLPVGNRSPFAPPYGSEFVAWAPAAQVEAWLDHRDPPLSAAERAEHYRVLNRIRLAGYFATSLEQVMALRRVLEQLAGIPGAAELESAVRALVARPRQPDIEDLGAVAGIRAPIFGPDGRVVLSLSVGQFSTFPTGPEAHGFIRRLLAGTRRISESLHGSEPCPDWARRLATGVTGDGRDGRRA
jgi:DNA-binding IclR family transcriptional regulator